MSLFKKIAFVLFLISTSLAAQNTVRIFKSVAKKGNKIVVTTNDGFYNLVPYTTKIIETSFIPNGEQFNAKSHAVILQPQNVNFKLKKFTNYAVLFTKGMSVVITYKPFKLTYFYKNNKLISEKKGYYKTEQHEVLDFEISEDEILYGGGARALGMNRRGYRLKLYNRAHYGYETHSELMNFTIPLVYSSKRYGIHFDNAPIGYLDLDSSKTNSLKYETISGRKTYQVIAGDSWEDLVSQYVTLTGKQPMLPRWAMGNFASRFGYHSQKEVEHTIAKFQEEQIPVDAVILDLYWFGKDIKGTMGNFEFYKDSFPDPKKMIKNLNDKGVKTVLISEPFILTTSNRWKEAVEADILGKNAAGKPYTYDFYFGNTGIIDIFSEKGHHWFTNIYKQFTDYGVAGWWGDLGEPEVHPSDLLHATGTADEVHNIYGHYWAKLVYDMYKTYFPQQRPFILMRAGYAGSQHYGMVPWSGDVNRTWGGLQSQVEIALQMGMQGLAYMHSDLGGFAGNNLDDELYVRWLQYGVFQPIYRPHAQEEVPSEPVFREESTKKIAKKAIELRYQLLPYNYNLVFQNSNYGLPLMKPLFFEDPTNKSLLTNSKSYLWGNNFLVSPIVEAKKTSQKVYFPKHSNWFNFYTDEIIEGGQTKTVVVNKNNIPTYVKAGAFIPMIKTIQNTTAYTFNNLDIHYYFDSNLKTSSEEIYNDDGKTPDAYKKGVYELLKLHSKYKNKKLKIKTKVSVGKNYTYLKKNINLVIHNVEKQPKKVAKYNYTWDEKLKKLSINLVDDKFKCKKIKIKW